jgi:hypothetical protein
LEAFAVGKMCALQARPGQLEQVFIGKSHGGKPEAKLEGVKLM